jgi:hypothetical protein
MEKEFKLLIETIAKFEGASIINTNVEATWIHFKLKSEASLAALSNQILDVKDQYPCNLLILSNQYNPNDFSYQLIIESEDRFMAMKILTKKLIAVLENGQDIKKVTQKELGLPDLSMVTVRQMANELKTRQNITFALVWTENNNSDNIAVEGKGDPNQVIGLLSRGSHIAIEWADKDFKFFQSEED